MTVSIEKFQEQGGRLKTDDIDFEAFRRQPLHPDSYLFGAGDGAQLVAKVEDRIDALPGLGGLGLMRKGIVEATAHVIAEEGWIPTPPSVSSAA